MGTAVHRLRVRAFQAEIMQMQKLSGEKDVLRRSSKEASVIGV